MITAHIASLPERVDTLKLTVESLLPQVDQLFVCLNNYESTPAFLYHDKITSALTDNSLGDAFKFFFVGGVKGYVLTCDDDLIYPSDYVERLINCSESHRAPISLLGKVYATRPIKSFRHGYTQVYRCLGEVDDDYKVDVVGTGALCYNTEDIKVSFSDFPHPNMADIWFSKLAHEQGVPLYVMKHPEGYVKHVLYEDRIWQTTVDETVQTQVINSFLK